MALLGGALEHVLARSTNTAVVLCLRNRIVDRILFERDARIGVLRPQATIDGRERERSIEV